jgi:hypothetical protein
MALSRDRMTVERQSTTFRELPVAANATIYAGGLVVLSAGLAEPGLVGLGLVAIGCAEEQVDNTGGANGAQRVRVKAGTFRFDSASGADTVTAADIGNQAYILDDHTVARTDGAGTRSPAGRIWDVDAQGVWVTIG